MCAVLILELLGTVILTVSAVSGLRFAETEPVQDLVALVIMALVANAWVLITLIGAYNRKTWGRSAALIVQIAVFAAAFAAFQGLLGFFTLGFLLLALATSGIAAVLKARPMFIANTPDT